MPKIKLKSVIIILSFLIAALIIAVSVFKKPIEQDDGIKFLVGVSQPNLEDPWRIAMNEEMKMEAMKYPEIKIIFYDAAQDNNKQRQDIENMVSQGIDLLIVSPNDSKFLSDTISTVYKQGIPVIVMEFPIESDDYSMLIYCDNKTIGKLAGEYISGLLGPKGGNILEVQGDPNSSITTDRKTGFREGLKGNPNIKIKYAVVGYWQRDLTEARVSEIYRKEPKVDIVFAYNDAMAIGAWRVANSQHINARFIGIGGLPGKFNGLDAVDNEILDATFLYPTGGKEAIINALKILNGEKVPKRIELGTYRITKENVKSYLK